jgi:hypothetical protein
VALPRIRRDNFWQPFSDRSVVDRDSCGGQAEIVELVLKIMRENESWEYTRVKEALKTLGYVIGRSTIKCILRDVLDAGDARAALPLATHSPG